MKINKKTVSQLIGLAVLFGAVEVTHQLTKTEEQTTYSVTLEDLALGNGETDGETGGATGGGGTDGETEGGTGGGTGNSGSSGKGAMVKLQFKAQKGAKVTVFRDGREVTLTCDVSGYTECRGRGDIACTPVVRELTNCTED